jgi:hypothetical protein
VVSAGFEAVVTGMLADADAIAACATSIERRAPPITFSYPPLAKSADADR